MNYTGIFDTHAHYDDEAFEADRHELLTSLPDKGIAAVINCGCDRESSLASLELCGKYGYFFCACGVHPHEASDCGQDFGDWLAPLLADKSCVAIGEIGLDYHYDFSPREVQLQMFESQLKLALELDMPVIVHDREAHGDCMELLRKYRPKGVMHCFSGSAELAGETTALGMYIGLGGAVTFKNARRPLEVARAIPQDRLLLETDCPYMTPVPYRGSRNSSDLIPLAAQVIARERETDPQHIIDIARENAMRLFNLK